MKKIIILSLTLYTVSHGMQIEFPELSGTQTQREYTDEDISHELLIMDRESIPVFPKTSGVEILKFFPNFVLVKTIFNKRLWTFSRNRQSGFCTLVGRKPFKKNRWGIFLEVYYIANAESEKYLTRTEDNANIWDCLQLALEEMVGQDNEQ